MKPRPNPYANKLCLFGRSLDNCDSLDATSSFLSHASIKLLPSNSKAAGKVSDRVVGIVWALVALTLLLILLFIVHTIRTDLHTDGPTTRSPYDVHHNYDDGPLPPPKDVPDLPTLTRRSTDRLLLVGGRPSSVESFASGRSGWGERSGRGARSGSESWGGEVATLCGSEAAVSMVDMTAPPGPQIGESGGAFERPPRIPTLKF
ncbi:hypothetical protein EDC01DRAFT_782266 [Geopyxis carbonaria]|nr:hypothetical protein EDC01DRAFT_782266 [Geopyxis carbonaria]